MQALSIHQLQKMYPNGTQALKGIDLSVAPGDFFALLGPNGAGKSTTIGIITSLVNKTAGTIQVFEHNLDTDPQAVKACIGLVPQEMNFNIFEKVIDILIYQAGYYGVPVQQAKQRAEYFLKKLDLWEKRNQICMHLSGGMKRRLMIARAFMHAPRLLILDEPTAGVDVEIRRTIWNFLKEMNQQGTTIILTTHYLEEAENLCQNIAIINHGRIVKNATFQQLLQQRSCETFIFDIATPLPAIPIGCPFIIRLSDQNHLEVDIQQTQTLNELFEFFQQQGIKITSMRNKTNRLEAFFLNLISDQKV